MTLGSVLVALVLSGVVVIGLAVGIFLIASATQGKHLD